MEKERKREIKFLEKGKVAIKTAIEEELSIEEFKNAHEANINSSQNIMYQLEAFKKEVNKLEGLKETKKDSELAEHLEKAQRIIQRKLLKSKMEKMETNLAILKKDLLTFSPHIAKLNQKDKREDTYIG